jgi:two-component system, chemotaxis family, protein-glutamate methylesterase/glutaminase
LDSGAQSLVAAVKKAWNPGMLRRNDPPPKSSDEQTEAQEQPVRSVIVIGASAGGRAVIGTVLKDLSHDIPAAIVVMLHVAPDSDFDLPKWFKQFGHIEIRETRQGERLREGMVFVAPPGHSLSIHDGQLDVKTLEHSTSPRHTINYLFESAAKTYGDRVIGVILSGYLADGSQGVRAVHEAGGLTIIQNPEDAEQCDMPANALKQVPEATFSLNGTDIGLTLDLMARRNAELETGLASAVRLLKDRIALLVRLVEQSKGNEATHGYLSTELNSLTGELQSVKKLLSESQ